MNTNEVSRIAALVGEPARTAMLLELMDGRCLTANELARAGGVGAATASRHLALMVDGGLLRVEQQGRHRYHQLASAGVASVLEGIMQLASASRKTTAHKIVPGPRDTDMRRARSCYDHIAGRLGVAITAKLLDDGAIAFGDDGGRVNASAAAVLAPLGIATHPLADTDALVQCRPCLDWSERRHHVAGRLGSLICAHCISSGWLRRRAQSRVLEITGSGAKHLGGWLGAERWQQVS